MIYFEGKIIKTGKNEIRIYVYAEFREKLEKYINKKARFILLEIME